MVHRSAQTVLFALALLLGGCSGVGNLLGGGAPGSIPTHPVTQPPANRLSVDQVNAAFADAEAYFETISHADMPAALQLVATHMVSSGKFTDANVGEGGIEGTLSDGSPAIFFADRKEDYVNPAATAAQLSTNATRRPNAIGSPTSHEIAFLVNMMDKAAFHPQRQMDFAQSFVNRGFTSNTYGVDVLEVTLENVLALGTSHPLDFLSIATHGIAVGGTKLDPYKMRYWFQSDTVTTTANRNQYFQDLFDGTVAYGWVAGFHSATFAFTPSFLGAHLRFNPGAIVINGSCSGQNPFAAPSTDAMFQKASVGRYIGWTRPVLAEDADAADAFIIDRLLGEQTPATGLAAYAHQQSPSQRPFPLDDIQRAWTTEIRNGPLGTQDGLPYGESMNGSPRSAKLVVSDYGGEAVANAPIEYGLPSIATLAVVENGASPTATLTIKGRFPTSTGTVSITDSTGAHSLQIVAWSSNSISATIAYNGAGLVQVTSVGGIQSNAVPLTQWKGQLVYKESDTIPTLSTGTIDYSGSGTGNLTLTYNVAFRADVHPLVQTIDQAPVPQNFAFSSVEADSTAVLWPFSGSFTATAPSAYSATFFLEGNVPETLTPAFPQPVDAGDVFDLRAYTTGTQPAPCNNGLPGVQGGPGNVFCPIAQWVADQNPRYNTGCVGGPCYDLSEGGSFGVPSIGAGGLIKMTMDPTTYAVTMPDSSTSFMSSHFLGRKSNPDRPAVATITGSFQTIFAPPSNTTPASKRRITGGT